MHFLSRTQVITAFGALALALFVLDLVRRRRLAEEYSLLWVVSTILIATLGFCTPLLQFITRAMGVLFESSTVFAVGLTFTISTLLYLSVKMSRLTQEHHELTRELALLRHQAETAPKSRLGAST